MAARLIFSSVVISSESFWILASRDGISIEESGSKMVEAPAVDRSGNEERLVMDAVNVC